MDKKEIEAMWIRYENGTSTKEERLIIDSWLLEMSKNSKIPPPDRKELRRVEKRLEKAIFEPLRFYQTIWFNCAVGVVVLGMTFAYLSFKSRGWDWDQQTIAAENSLPAYYANDIDPGINKATLVLAGGKVISLSAGKIGLHLTNDSEITYNDGSAVTNGSDISVSGTNTLSTAKGETYQITLSDGTKVWLNAASVLKFPVSFSGSALRKVSLIGEAYFEVAKDARHPFQVKTVGETVQVLGTNFNVNAYPDEAAIKTTLLEGSVKIGSMVIKPGEEHINTDGKIDVKPVEVDLAVAWQKGEFMFSKEPLALIMASVARWYDLEVVYTDAEVQQRLFGGTISRFGKVSQVLQMLELTGEVHFSIEGRRITVSK